QLKAYIMGQISEFKISETEKSAVTPAEYMKKVSASITENEAAGSTDEKSGVSYGTFEKKTFYSDVCGRNKNINVLLPAGYSQSKKYPVLYALHGYWGNEDSLLDAGDASLRLRQIIGNAIASGDAEDMIVVFPDIYASATQDKCDGLNDKNNAAYDNFINVLTKEIMPYMEQNYSIKTGRDNTAITGFSMGGRESLYIGFSRPDLFGYVGAMCPAPGLTTDLIKSENLKFSNTEPYLLMVSAGSDDQVVFSTPSGYNDNLNSNNVNHIWHYVTGGDHGGKTIRPHMYNFVRSIFKA
ncbi:MAG TPA: glycoside hydrolase family 43, partial [Ruminococcus sp.]|nr:glycoside hydrolase family 43 [Ruminococcus sp.]